MVNASLNWASIVGIVLAVGGAFLYFMRSFKPALARDYDVFFAAVGLLCGGILFFQGWRLDPILQFGQFLLAGTTVFFAYESVRLRGITTEQARRSSYFDEEEPAPFRPRGGMGSGPWDGPDRFSEPEPLRRRIRSQDEEEEDFYRPRRASRAAIPERAASRMSDQDAWDSDAPGPGDRAQPSPYRAGGRPTPDDFGARRRDKEESGGGRRGTRPVPGSRRPTAANSGGQSQQPISGLGSSGMPQGSPLPRRGGRGPGAGEVSDADFSPMDPGSRPAPASSPASAKRPEQGSPPPRDNSSRFDD
ncbi:MAG: Ycf66 family protein [Cyanobacteriota bacterium]|nr:Ycf66 family protein [Cyanobacteriota bacterium]